MSTFHTLARVKAETGDPEPQRRIDAEAEVIALLRRHPGRRASAEADQLVRPLRRRPGPHRDRAAGRRPRLLLARRPARRPQRALGLGDAARAAVRRPHPAAQGPRRRRRAPSPSSRRPDATLRRRRRAERRRRRRRGWRAVRRLVDELGLADAGPVRRRRSPTTCCRPTTGPPTCASCRAGRSRSGSSPSRPPPAARRWSPPRSAGCAPSSTTAAPASWSRAATRGLRRGRRRGSWPTPAWPPAMARPAAAAGAGLHLVDDRGPAAPPLRRPVARSPRRLRRCQSSMVDAGGIAARSSTCLEAVIDAWLADELADNPDVAAVDRGEPGRAPLVRAVARASRRTPSRSGSRCASGRSTTRPT